MRHIERYRPNVSVIITDGSGNVLLCKRVDEKYSGTWQCVQGGIDAGESAVQAAIRETQEELGVRADEVTILDVMEEKFSYRWDDSHIKQWNTDFVGQEQTFVYAQVPRDAHINLDAHHREFTEAYWGSPEELVTKCWERKRPGISAALHRLGLLIARS